MHELPASPSLSRAEALDDQREVVAEDDGHCISRVSAFCATRVQVSPPRRTWPSGRQAETTVAVFPIRVSRARLGTTVANGPVPEGELSDEEHETGAGDDEVPRRRGRRSSTRPMTRNTSASLRLPWLLLGPSASRAEEHGDRACPHDEHEPEQRTQRSVDDAELAESREVEAVPGGRELKPTAPTAAPGRSASQRGAVVGGKR